MYCLAHRCSADDFLLLQIFSGVCFTHKGSTAETLLVVSVES